MTKLLDVTSGRIVMRDADGTVTFDTLDKLFQAGPTDYKTGAITLGPYHARYNTPDDVALGLFPGDTAHHLWVEIDTNHDLGSVHSSADTVVGAFKVTGDPGNPRGNDGLGWFSAGGTYVHFGGDVDTAENPNVFFRGGGFAAFTFYCSGGRLYLNERVALYPYYSQLVTPYSTRITLAQVTLDYKLFCGSFV